MTCIYIYTIIALLRVMPTLTILFWHSSWCIIWNYIWHFLLKEHMLKLYLTFFLARALIARGDLGPSIPPWRLAERGTLPVLPDLFQHRRRSSGWLGVRPSKRGKLGLTKMGTSHHNFPQLLAYDLPSFTHILLEQARSLGKWHSSQQYIF
jgi:hypothetical protein